MLGTMMVLLQRQLPAGLHPDTPHLMALAFVDGLTSGAYPADLETVI
jgi:hypothetical protein